MSLLEAAETGRARAKPLIKIHALEGIFWKTHSPQLSKISCLKPSEIFDAKKLKSTYVTDVVKIIIQLRKSLVKTKA